MPCVTTATVHGRSAIARQVITPHSHHRRRHESGVGLYTVFPHHLDRVPGAAEEEVLQSEVAERHPAGLVAEDEQAAFAEQAQAFVERELPGIEVRDEALVHPDDVPCLMQQGETLNAVAFSRSTAGMSNGGFCPTQMCLTGLLISSRRRFFMASGDRAARNGRRQESFEVGGSAEAVHAGAVTPDVVRWRCAPRASISSL